MLERRMSARLPLSLKARELNGDYMYSWNVANLSEEGLFLSNKVCFGEQDPFSRLTFTLPNGTELRNITARIVRETRTGQAVGCGYEFLNLTEDDRMALKRFALSREAS